MRLNVKMWSKRYTGDTSCVEELAKRLGEKPGKADADYVREQTGFASAE